MEGKHSCLLGEKGALIQRSNSIVDMSHPLHANEGSHSIDKLSHEPSQVTLAYIGPSFSKKEKRKTRFFLLVRKLPEWVRERKKQSQTAQPISFLSPSGQVNRLLFAWLGLHTCKPLRWAGWGWGQPWRLGSREAESALSRTQLEPVAPGRTSASLEGLSQPVSAGEAKYCRPHGFLRSQGWGLDLWTE